VCVLLALGDVDRAAVLEMSRRENAVHVAAGVTVEQSSAVLTYGRWTGVARVSWAGSRKAVAGLLDVREV
jgi:hypothetical protein